jgi:hypothetical protein
MASIFVYYHKVIIDVIRYREAAVSGLEQQRLKYEASRGFICIYTIGSISHDIARRYHISIDLNRHSRHHKCDDELAYESAISYNLTNSN